MTILLRKYFVSAALMLFPGIAFAQASITGVVRDASGGVLPGVTVEASSPALIEKVRTVVTDGTGQYRIVDLRPGTYVVTFTLPGFSVVRREGIELSGSLTATINVEMRVGAVEETVTVTGESPIVDVQSITQQRVLDKETIDVLPTGRTTANIAVLVPGVVLSTTFSGEGQDVGGTTGDVQQTLSIHGSRGNEGRRTMDGLNLGVSEGGTFGGFSPNMGAVQEVTVDTSAVSAEQSGGGVRVNLVPREGGNTFSGSFFLTGSNESFQSDNFTDRLKGLGGLEPNAVKVNYDINPAFGGPLVRDKLWFFTAARWYRVENYVTGAVRNANVGNAASWTYAPDPSFRGARESLWRSINGRLTWQATQKQKLSFFYDDQSRCTCYDLRALISPEAAADFKQPQLDLKAFTYTAPLTNRLLVEIGYSYLPGDWGYFTHEGDQDKERLVGVLEQSTGLSYRGPRRYFGNQIRFSSEIDDSNLRGSVSYVTGAHALKVGAQQHWAFRHADNQIAPREITYIFNNGSPINITQGLPFVVDSRTHPDLGLYVQDRWTIDRLTLNLGLRFDWIKTSFDAVTLGPSEFAPDRNVALPEQDFANFKDLTPKLGAAYDLFGNGRTALRTSLAKYLGLVSAHQTYGADAAPSARTANFAQRSWTDANQNFNPECDLTSTLGNGECGPLSDQNFGRTIQGTSYDDEAISGWGVRPYNWEFSIAVQHALTPEVGLDVGFFRRWYGNFTVLDNLAVSPSDFNEFSVTAPADERLEEAAGRRVSGLYNVVPTRFGQTSNLFTLADNFGGQEESWQGVDLSINARLAGGAIAQGGISTGRTISDTCELRRSLPETAPLNPYCRTVTPYLTQVKLLGAYTIPRADVQVSATFQSIPGPQLAANVNFASATAIAPSLGRPLSGNQAVAQINVVEPGSMYGDRLNQVDFRVGKLLRYGGTRTAVSVDLYNALNSDAILTENSNFAVWRQPLSVLSARLLKFSVNFDF